MAQNNSTNKNNSFKAILGVLLLIALVLVVITFKNLSSSTTPSNVVTPIPIEDNESKSEGSSSIEGLDDIEDNENSSGNSNISVTITPTTESSTYLSSSDAKSYLSTLMTVFNVDDYAKVLNLPLSDTFKESNLTNLDSARLVSSYSKPYITVDYSGFELISPDNYSYMAIVQLNYSQNGVSTDSKRFIAIIDFVDGVINNVVYQELS